MSLDIDIPVVVVVVVVVVVEAFLISIIGRTIAITIIDMISSVSKVIDIINEGRVHLI